MTALEIHDLTVSLSGRPVLRSIDLSVSSGEVVALLGANGSGKSTLVRTIVGIIPADSGTIALFGHELGPKVDWTRVGYVPQRITAGSGVPATVAEVVTSGLLSGWSLRTGRGVRGKVLAALEQVGLAERADLPVGTLSGGQQQRVLIARALIREPDLLLLDEPVSGVDLPSQASFARTLGSLRDGGTTVVVVLHEIGAFEPLIKRAIVLRQGIVVHDGDPIPPRPAHAGDNHDHVHPHDESTTEQPSATRSPLPLDSAHD